MSDPKVTTVRRDDGTWDVVRRDTDEVFSSHPRQAGAEADAFQLADSDAETAEDADAVLTDGQGANPDQTSG